MQAFSSTLYGQFPGYAEPYFDVVLQTENVSFIQSPQVRAAARRHFDCPAMPGAALEDDLGRGSSGSHWEMRLFRVRPAPCTPHHATPSTRSYRVLIYLYICFLYRRPLGPVAGDGRLRVNHCSAVARKCAMPLDRTSTPCLLSFRGRTMNVSGGSFENTAVFSMVGSGLLYD